MIFMTYLNVLSKLRRHRNRHHLYTHAYLESRGNVGSMPETGPQDNFSGAFLSSLSLK